jgi:DNA-binding response OmpR family regulator
MIHLKPNTRRAGTVTVAVVDSRPDDYAALPQTVRRRDLAWRFLTTGQEALRAARTESADLWVVNTVLPDISGIDICNMLRSRSPPPGFYVVTDAYRPEEERAARICGAALFGCKPARAEWFDIDLTIGGIQGRKEERQISRDI